MARKSTALVLVAVLALSLGATSCGGGGSGGSGDLVLVGFNIPNIAGVALNQPLIFTFSADIDPASITPDTLRVTGALGPNFETTVVDGNLVALLPRSPNFEDYSDAGLLPGVRYTVSFAVFPAPDTIRTPSGKPLLSASSFEFDTDPIPEFIEARRPIHPGPPPGDALGCLNNGDNVLPTTQQFGSGPGARLLCLKNEGRPQIVWDDCTPQHTDEAVGTPALNPGLVNLPALRVVINEPLDPTTVVPWSTSTKWSENIQLWRVGDTNKVPPEDPLDFERIRVNKPLIVQSLEKTEMILVAANEDEFGDRVGGVKQGTYLINVTKNIHDLNGNELAIDESLPAGAFQEIDDLVTEAPQIPNGYRIYFVTLVVPGDRQTVSEGYDTNLNEWGDIDSTDTEPGVFTYSETTGDPNDPLARIADTLLDPPGAATPSFTTTGTDPGQTCTANWNDGFRLFNVDTLEANSDASSSAGALQAVWMPHCGTGADGHWESRPSGSQTPVDRTLITTPGPDASVNDDGIYEFRSFTLRAGDNLFVSGTQPLVILCRGDFIVEAGATIHLEGTDGGPGFDTDGTFLYTNPGALPAGGPGGLGNAGGGAGGQGADPVNDGQLGGSPGTTWTGLFGSGPSAGAGQGGSSGPSGGGGGGMSANGMAGTFDNGDEDGDTVGEESNDSQFRRELSLFAPDRGYSPFANGSGGTGAGGGGANDADGSDTGENGDDGGAGGGSGGGGIYVICCGEIVVNGDILADGGNGGNTYAQGDQKFSDPDPNEADNEYLSGWDEEATPSGAGAPGGGGSGGGIFLCGLEGVTLGADSTLTAEGGVGGASGLTDPGAGTGTELIGGAGASGIIVLASRDTADIDANGSLDPGAAEVSYQPTVDLDSAGMSRWFDLVSATTKFVGFRWEGNFNVLLAEGLTQGTDYDVYLEVQGADSLTPNPADDTPTAAQGLTQWFTINDNDVNQDRVTFDPDAPGGASPIDGKRYFRYRWRFHVPADYPGWADGATEAAPMPQIRTFTVEYER